MPDSQKDMSQFKMFRSFHLSLSFRFHVMPESENFHLGSFRDDKQGVHLHMHTQLQEKVI